MRKTLNDITMPTNKHFGDADVMTTREIQCILDNPVVRMMTDFINKVKEG